MLRDLLYHGTQEDPASGSERIETGPGGQDDSLLPLTDYLTSLHRRMVEVGFPENDVIFVRVRQARDAVQILLGVVHCHSLRSGSLGKKPDER